MTSIDYTTHGTCSRQIHVELDRGIIRKVEFTGGCPGNTTGISHLVAGMNAREVMEKLAGTPCRDKGTSCPDQLSKALKAALEKEEKD